MDNIKRFTFRLPEKLFDELEKIAKSKHRSVNSEVIVAIEEYLKSVEALQKSDND